MAVCKNPFEGFGCGQCIPCRLNHRRVWTSRIMLESYCHAENSFLTLTYDDDHVPRNDKGQFVLDFEHLKDFYKRLRERLRSSGIFVRHFSVGEYGHEGERLWNPHFHAALFGYSCEGKLQRPETGIRCHCSRCELVRQVWQQGNVTVDELNPTTAAYVAGYTMKKMTNPDDERLEGRPPEDSRMSLKPGIGLAAIDVMERDVKGFGDRVLQHGDVPSDILVGRDRMPLGRYLKRKWREQRSMEKINPETGEVTYGTPYETLSTLKALASPELYSLQKDIAASPSQEKYVEMDTLRSDLKARRLQKVKNIESKHNIYKGVQKL